MAVAHLILAHLHRLDVLYFGFLLMLLLQMLIYRSQVIDILERQVLFSSEKF